MIGGTLGHYRLLERIGAGGMGVVYRALDLRLGREVALKVLPPSAATDAVARERLLREARHASQLNHPSVCTIHEVGEDSGQIYVAMELVAGRSLAESVGPTGFPPSAVIRYGIQIAEALEHAHQRHLVHRDLKSLNVMLTGDGRIKVLDFGLSRRLPSETASTLTSPSLSLTHEGAIAGTPQYLAPELLQGSEASEGSDIWALGVMLFEMASGALPFKGQTMYQLGGSILHAPPAPLPDAVPAALKQVIARCLEKVPSRRYLRAGEVRAALEALQSQPALPIPATPRPASGSARTWRWLALAGVVAVAIAGAWAWRTWREGVPQRTASGGPGVARSIAVMPFTVRGDAGFGYLGDAMVGILGSALDGAGDLHDVEAPAVLAALSGGHAAPTSPADARRLARRLGAGLVVMGDVTATRGTIRIEASIYDTNRDSLALVHAAADGPASGVDSIETSLARNLLVVLTGVLRPNLSYREALTTRSLPALKAYLQGLAAWDHGDNVASEDAYARAVAADTSFALAWYGLCNAQWGRGDFDAASASADRAAGLGEALPEHERTVLEGLRAVLHGDFDASEALLRRATAERPDELDSWQLLAEELWSYSALRGRSPAEAEGAMQRVVELDPSNAHTWWLLAREKYMDGDMAPAESLLTRSLEVGAPADSLVPRFLLATWRSDSTTTRSLQRELARAGPGLVVDLAMTLCVAPQILLELLSGVKSQSYPVEQRAKARIAQAMTLQQLGKPDSALVEMRAAGALLPLPGSAYGALIACCLTAPTPRRTLDSLRSIVRSWPEPPLSAAYADTTSAFWVVEGPLPLARLYLLALLSARMGDRAATAEYAAQLDRFRGARDVTSRAAYYALAARAMLAWQCGQPAQALAELERAPIPSRPGNRWGLRAFLHERYLRAELLYSLGRADEALGWFEGTGRPLEWDAMYAPESYLRRAQILEQKGDRAHAAEFYRRAVEMRVGCAPAYQPMLAQARAGLARLSAGLAAR
ncbi:MAG TPA: protein kinase [Candidatus Acidoferrales bacterium]|nr:protein kinase [Candidatus Acidoferrales bacterium]